MYTNNHQQPFEPHQNASYPEDFPPSNGVPAFVPQNPAFELYQMPPRPPRFIITQIHTCQILQEVHRLPLHFFELNNGEIVCRHGPCMSCYPGFYVDRSILRRGFVNTAYNQTQSFDHAWKNDYVQPAAPPMPTPRSELVQPPANVTQNTINDYQSAPALPPMGTFHEPNKQEVFYGQEPNFPPHSEFPPRAGEQPNGEHNMRFKGQMVKAAREEAAQRIQQWRTQLPPIPAINQGQSTALPASQNEFVAGHKRKTPVDSFEEVSTVGEKRLKSESGDAIAQTSTYGAQTPVAHDARPCRDCRRCHRVRIYFYLE